MRQMISVLIAVLMATTVAGCQTAPSKESGTGKITTVGSDAGRGVEPLLRAVVISITNEEGAEVFNIKKKSLFQEHVVLPAGIYRGTFTCAPMKLTWYEDWPSNSKHPWKYPISEMKFQLKSGDFINLTAEVANTLSGPVCRIVFTVPKGQIL